MSATTCPRLQTWPRLNCKICCMMVCFPDPPKSMKGSPSPGSDLHKAVEQPWRWRRWWQGTASAWDGSRKHHAGVLFATHSFQRWSRYQEWMSGFWNNMACLKQPLVKSILGCKGMNKEDYIIVIGDNLTFCTLKPCSLSTEWADRPAREWVFARWLSGFCWSSGCAFSPHWWKP